MTTPQGRDPRPTLAHMEEAYHDMAARTNNAMSALLAACGKLDHDTKMAIVQAAIRYSDLETTRHMMAQRVRAFKIQQGL